MWHAASRGHLNIMQLLLEQGADKNKANNDGMTPLLIAAKKGHMMIVQALLEQGVDKEKADSSGWTALFYAACTGHFPIVQYLVEQGADMEKATNGGFTPLIIASLRGHLEVVRYLLEQGADRDKATVLGYTSLHYAAQYGHLETAMLLMSYGADLNARNNRGRLPIDMARTEAIKQAIRDEPRRRMDHDHKRATEQDRHPNAATSANAQQDDKVGQEAVITEEEAKILAEINEDSEPSDEEDDWEVDYEPPNLSTANVDAQNSFNAREIIYEQ